MTATVEAVQLFTGLVLALLGATLIAAAIRRSPPELSV